MATVFLDSLSIENFGPFYGPHEFQFTNIDNRCGILIGGKNGAGKTHLLRALYMAVVGEGGKMDLAKMDKDSDATRFNLDKSLNRRAKSEGQDSIRLSVTLSLRDERSDVMRRAQLNREIRFRPNSPPNWSSTANKLDGSATISDEKQLEKLRDVFLQRHLARFFFFDAERSQSLNLRQDDIVEGISRILGLWSYTELENDLRYLIQTKIPTVYRSTAMRDASTKLAELSGKISETSKLIIARRQEHNFAEVELTETQSEISQVEDELRSLGAVDPEVLSLANSRRAQAGDKRAELFEKLRSSWEQALPVALLSDFRGEIHDSLMREERRRDWEGSKAAVEPKIPQIKQDVFDGVPGEFCLGDDTLSFYAARLEKALHRLFHPPPEGMSDGLPFLTDRNDTSAQIRALLLGGSQPVATLAQETAEIDALDNDLRELDSQIRGLSQSQASIERGRELHQRRGELGQARDGLQKQLVNLDVEIAALEHRLGELMGQEKVQSDLVEKAEAGQSLTTVAARYREATTRIKEKAAVQLREKIAQEVGALWTEIVGRQREFLGLEFDPHWGCYLIRRDGERVLWEDANTSAGQRQVRMLAFYEALRRLARSVPPLVVDTPLGRLDKEVRQNVLDKLYLSGHQSLILSTNSEIDPDSALFEGIKSRLARVYTLNPHGASDSIDYEVSVSGDYFGRPL